MKRFFFCHFLSEASEFFFLSIFWVKGFDIFLIFFSKFFFGEAFEFFFFIFFLAKIFEIFSFF